METPKNQDLDKKINSGKKPKTGENLINETIEKLKLDPKTTNINEVIQKLVVNIIEQNVKEFRKKGEITLEPEKLYNVVKSSLESADKSLSKDNPFKGTLKTFVDNFLVPQEKGKEYINFALEQISIAIDFPKHKDNISALSIDKFRTLSKMFTDAVCSMIDIAKNQHPDQAQLNIQKMVDEFVKIDEIQNVLSKYPDIETVLRRILPKVMQKLDKTKVSSQLNSFFEKNIESIYQIGTSNETDPNLRMKITNEFLKLFNGLIDNNDLLDILTDTKDLDVIKNNEITNTFLNALLNPNIPQEKKNSIVQDLKNFAILSTNPSATENDLTISLDKCISHIGYLLSVKALSEDDVVKILTKAFNIDPKQQIDAVGLLGNQAKNGFTAFYENNILPMFESVGEFFGMKKAQQKQESQNVEINNFMKLMELIWQNKDNIIGVTRNTLTEKFKTVEDLIRWLVRENVLEKNLAANNYKLIQAFKEAIDFKIKDSINQAKQTLSQIGNPIDIHKIAQNSDIIDQQQNSLLRVFAAQVIESIKSQSEKTDIKHISQYKLTKENITNIIKESLQKLVEKHSDILLDFAKTKGIKIPDGTYGKQLLVQLTTHPEFSKLIEGILGSIISKINPDSNILLQISGIVRDIKDGKIDISTKTKETALNIGFDVIDKNIDNESFTKLLIANLPNSKILKDIGPQELTKITKIFKESNFLNSIKQVIKSENLNISDLTKFDKNKLIDLVFKVLNSPNTNQTLLYSRLIESGIIGKLNSGKSESDIALEKIIDEKTINKSIDILFDMTHQISEENFINAAHQIGFDKIFGKGLYEFISITKDTDCKEKLKKIMSSNKEFIIDAIRGNINDEKLFDIMDETFSAIPKEKRLEILNRLIEIGVLKDINQNFGTKELKMSQTQAISVSNMIFKTLESGDKQQINNLIKKILTEYNLDGLLSNKHFGQELGENIYDLLNSIGKDNFTKFLVENTENINQLRNISQPNIRVQKMSELGIKLLNKIDGNKLQEIFGGKPLKSHEFILLKNFQAIQKTVGNYENINQLTTQALELKQSFESKQILDETKLSSYAENVFDFTNMLFQNIDKNEFIKDINQILNSKTSQDQKNKEISDILTNVFIKNNLLFCGKTFFSNFFSIIFGSGLNKGETLVDYFSNTGNKENFKKTMSDFFKKYCNK